MLRALRGHCQNKTLQQIDTTLGRSQPIALGPGRTFVSEKVSDVCRHVTRGRRVRQRQKVMCRCPKVSF